MTYSESARGLTITAKRAAQEVISHGLDPEEFFTECGYRADYLASEVLDWLGY